MQKNGNLSRVTAARPLTRLQIRHAQPGSYRIKISKNLYLDAEQHHHFEGRYINDGERAGKGVNVRFAAGYTTNTCSTTNLRWIRVFATRDIEAGEELYLSYGDEYWGEDDLVRSNVSPPKQLSIPGYTIIPVANSECQPLTDPTGPDNAPVHATTTIRDDPPATTFPLVTVINSTAHTWTPQPWCKYTTDRLLG